MTDWKAMSYGPARYHAYLASREWALLKHAIRTRAGGICENCHHSDAEETHHLTYARLYREKPDDLIAVCHECHQFLSAESGPQWEEAVNRPGVQPGSHCCNAALSFVETPEIVHYGKMVCSKCLRFLSWSKYPTPELAHAKHVKLGVKGYGCALCRGARA